MTIITLEYNENDKTARQMIESILSQGLATRKKPQHVIDYEESLHPMTIAEYHTRIDRAMEDVRAGRVISHEEVGRHFGLLR